MTPRIGIVFALAVTATLLTWPQAGYSSGLDSLSLTAQPSGRWQPLLMNARGWIGADCACSVPLSRTTVLWLFDDTFVGEIRNGRRYTHGPMVRNTLGVQTGLKPATARVRFVVGDRAPDGTSGVLNPPDGIGWFWFGGGVVAGGRLWLTLWQMESTGEHSAFGFRTKASWIASVANYLDPPEHWKPVYERLPFYGADGADDIQFGNALMKSGRWVYVYGLRETRGSSPPRRGLVVARAPASQLGDLESWQFLTGRGWSRDWKQAVGSGADIGSEFSVSPIPDFHGYALVYSPSTLAPDIRISMADSPAGPWSVSRAVYTCPESKKPSVFCYAARAHPELSTAGTLVATYATNSFSFTNVINDSSLYFPQFVRIFFRKGK